MVLPAPAAKAKSDAEKAEEQQRVIIFQKERAVAGKAWAQYDLGLRYLKGDGVAQDQDAARKWLAAAASQGHEDARQRLRRLNETQTAKQ